MTVVMTVGVCVGMVDIVCIERESMLVCVGWLTRIIEENSDSTAFSMQKQKKICNWYVEFHLFPAAKKENSKIKNFSIYSRFPYNVIFLRSISQVSEP